MGQKCKPARGNENKGSHFLVEVQAMVVRHVLETQA